MSDHATDLIRFLANHPDLTVRFSRSKDADDVTEIRMTHRRYPIFIDAEVTDAAVDDTAWLAIRQTLAAMVDKLADMCPAMEHFKRDHPLEIPPTIGGDG